MMTTRAKNRIRYATATRLRPLGLLIASLLLPCLGMLASASAECCEYQWRLLPEGTNNIPGDCCGCEGKHTLDVSYECCDEDHPEPEITCVQETPEPCDPEAETYTVNYKITVICAGEILEETTETRSYDRDCSDCSSGKCLKGAGTAEPSLPTGEAPPKHTFRLGMSTTGKTLGFLRMPVEINEAGVVYAGPINPVIQAQDIDVVYDTSNAQYLRQIMAPEC
ncbi:MAG: hypothetical protein GX590_11665, partial [Lentisphaerae bacterium]|nr:hypothetical protein [Lentisphaerota bacterium]